MSLSWPFGFENNLNINGKHNSQWMLFFFFSTATCWIKCNGCLSSISPFFSSQEEAKTGTSCISTCCCGKSSFKGSDSMKSSAFEKSMTLAIPSTDWLLSILWTEFDSELEIFSDQVYCTNKNEVIRML